MDPLQNINGLLQEYQKLDRNRNVKRSDNVQSSSLNSDALKESNADKESIRDSVSISADSKTLLEKEKDVSRYLQELEQLKSVDEEQLTKIKNRLESGYYNEPAVMEKVMHDLLVNSPIPVNNSFDVESADLTAAAAPDESAAPASQSDLNAIRNKIQNNAYNSDAVMSAVANKILGIE